MKNWYRHKSNHSTETLIIYESPCGQYSISKFEARGFESKGWVFEKKLQFSPYEETIYSNKSFQDVKQFAKQYIAEKAA